MNHKIISKVTAGMLLCTFLGYTAPVFAYTKDETVYTKLNTTGSNYQTVVNSHIENLSQSQFINDLSDLAGIKNVNGEETFTQEGNQLVWSANGNDIYYQGESKKELPIECKVTYFLDEKEISADEIAGKSGKVKITIEYINKDAHTVRINGKTETLYTPFVALCGTIVKNEQNKNITIVNGKAIDDGTKTTLIGMAFPGLQESLNISNHTFDIPNKIEITLETTNFELNNIITFVTPNIMEDSNIDISKEISNLYNQVNTLESASKQLVSGSATLKEGADTYTQKSKEFNAAMKQIASGTNTIHTNYKKIDSGIHSLSSGSSTLQDGMNTLNNGIHELSSNLNSLPSSVTALYQGSSTLTSGITSVSNGVSSLEQTLSQTISTSIATLQANNATLENEITALKKEKTELTTQITTLNQVKEGIEDIDNQTSIQTVITELTAKKEALSTKIESLSLQKEKNAAVISKLTPTAESQKQLKSLNEGLTQISEGSKQLTDNLKKLNAASSSLPNALSKLSSGSKSLLTGSKEISTGAKTLTQGSKSLKSGLETLDTNTQKLVTANSQLTDGASTLADGASTLSEGLDKFYHEGIQSICNYINGNVKDMTTRLEKLQQLSKEYYNFSGLEDGNDGNVKFIMIMDNIKKEENDKQEMIVENKKESK